MNLTEVIQQTVSALIEGKTILYPTDTIWGIGCDARNHNAIERLYAIKERDHSKSMIVLVESGKWHPEGKLNTLKKKENTVKKVESEDRPTTYILPRSIWHDEMHLEVADNITAADGSLGIRIPQHTFCQEILHQLGAPLVSTSANLSGHPSPKNYNEIEEALKQRINFCIPPLPEFLSSETRGSRIIKINPDGSQTILRP